MTEDKTLQNLPPLSLLSMPIQNLHTAPQRHGRPFWRLETTPRLLWMRRLFIFGGALLLTGYSTFKINKVFNSLGTSPFGIIMLVLFSILSFWISLSCISAVGGFWSLITKGGQDLEIPKDIPLPTLQHRTAILLPTYNESPRIIINTVYAMLSSLHEAGRLTHFDLFILSDTTHPDIWVQEEQAFLYLKTHSHIQNHIFYRRRFKNIDRKVGNITNWITQYGNSYSHMLTLDADSLMAGSTIIRMTSLMEQNPHIGLLQSLPVIIGGRTLFARMQQFAGRIYGPLIAHGIAWWHGSESNYWGHNALIRIEAFAEQAGLPHLSGSPPFGGHILSHDFVEAALMRRGGWSIHIIPELQGSYEESPPSLTDIAIRDRRWCQGNLQHARILTTKGLHWISRSHMLVGIGSYVMSPLWLLFLLSGILIALQSHFQHPEYFSTERTLYPNWPHVDPVEAKSVFISTMIILLMPKFLSFMTTLNNKKQLEDSGGATRLSVSILLETIIGAFIAPISMFIQTSAILSILLGRDSGWKSQNRVEDSISWPDITKGYWIYSLFGLALSVAAFSVSIPLFLWMLPVLIGLLFSIPLVALTSSPTIGNLLRKYGLLLIPEENSPSPIIENAYNPKTHAPNLIEDAFCAIRNDNTLRKLHLQTLPAPRKAGDPIHVPYLTGILKLKESSSIQEALQRLTLSEKSSILTTSEGISILIRLPYS